MKYTPLRDVPSAVRSRQEFSGGSVFSTRDRTDYVVYSYGHHWPLYVWHAGTNRAFLNTEKYSVTTGKHLSYVRRGAANPATCGVEFLKEFVGGSSAQRAMMALLGPEPWEAYKKIAAATGATLPSAEEILAGHQHVSA